ncbi:hypothetical protein CAPTEDRAFT_117025, partial [Capitella teleta]
CEEGWHYDRTGGNCYMINENVLSWEVARTHCMAFKGDLASITGPDDKAFIRELTMSSTSSVFWIGGNEINQSSGWTWSDGSPFSFLDWDVGKPDNSVDPEWCIETLKVRNSQWNDQDCSKQLPSICQKKCKHCVLIFMFNTGMCTK